MSWSGKFKYFSVFGLIAALLVTSSVFAAAGNSQWPSAGYDLSNTHYNSSESTVNVSNAANLTKAWNFTTGGDVSAIPAADGTNVYVPDWAGNLYAVDQKTGEQVWTHKISDYTGVSGDYARATPAIVGNMLIFGDQGGKFLAGANLIAVNKTDGSLIWVKQVDKYPAAIITQSAVVDTNGPFKYPVVYVGISSLDEFYATNPNYTISFRGSILAVNANTGEIVWRQYDMPKGYTGGAIWGSTPAVDNTRGLLYVDTGNNYTVPEDVLTCITNANGDPAAEQACVSDKDHFDSVISNGLPGRCLTMPSRSHVYSERGLAKARLARTMISARDPCCSR